MLTKLTCNNFQKHVVIAFGFNILFYLFSPIWGPILGPDLGPDLGPELPRIGPRFGAQFGANRAPKN